MQERPAWCAPLASQIMPQQPDLFSTEPDASDPRASAALGALDVERGGRARRNASPWLYRAELLVRVLVQLYLGLLITVLPWMRFWTENGLFSYVPGGALLAGSGFVRGIVSGLGLLNVVLAVQSLFSPRRR